MRYLKVLIVAGVILLLTSNAHADTGGPSDNFTGSTDVSEVVVSGESARPAGPGPGRYTGASAPVFIPAATDVPIIRDSTGSYCISDLQFDDCIPDPGGPVDDDDPPAGPSIVDVVQAIGSQIERDVSRLPVIPARVHYQPEGGEVLVNIETIFYTSTDTQYLSTSVLGRAVTIEATPAYFEWDFGDGSAALRTSDPGGPYPDHTISHVYESAAENYITLRTTWNARFRVEGVSNWLPISGQPVTVDQVGPLRSVTKTNKLVLVD